MSCGHWLMTCTWITAQLMTYFTEMDRWIKIISWQRHINYFYWSNVIFSSHINKCKWYCRIQAVLLFYAASWDDLCWPLGRQCISRVVYYLENATQPWNSLQQVLTSPAGRQPSSSPAPWHPKIPRQGDLDGSDPLRDAQKHVEASSCQAGTMCSCFGRSVLHS